MYERYLSILSLKEDEVLAASHYLFSYIVEDLKMISDEECSEVKCLDNAVRKWIK